MKKIVLLLMLGMICSSYKTDDDAGQWIVLKAANTPPARNECGFAAVNGKLYLVGGDAPAAPVEVFNPATATWYDGAPAPVIMHHFQPVSLGNNIYILDAFADRNYPNQVPLANSYCYNTITGTWKQLAGLPEGRRRAGAGAAVYNGKLYLVCGILHGHSSGTTNMFDVYDPATNTWAALPPAPRIRDHSTAVVVKNKLYAVGGRNTSLHDAGNFMSFFDKVVLDVDCYDFKTGKWSTLAAKLPLGTGGGTCVNLDDTIYYIGGERATATKPNGPQTDVFYMNPDVDKEWKEAPGVNKARNGVGGAVLGHKIYIAGGAQGDIGLEVFSRK